MDASVEGFVKKVFEGIQKQELKHFRSLLLNLEGIDQLKRYFLWTFAVMVVYFLWILKFSIAPVLLLCLFGVFHLEWKRERHKRHAVAKEMVAGNEKTVIESKIKSEDLPSWVLFPDKVMSISLNTKVYIQGFNLDKHRIVRT